MLGMFILPYKLSLLAMVSAYLVFVIAEFIKIDVNSHSASDTLIGLMLPLALASALFAAGLIMIIKLRKQHAGKNR